VGRRGTPLRHHGPRQPYLSAANRGLALLYYLSLIASTALILLAVAAPDVPAANRAADRIEGWVREMTRTLLFRVRGRLIRAASFLFTAGGVAVLVVYTTVPAGNSTADPDPHLVVVCFLFFMDGILLVLLRVAAPDLIDDEGENAVAHHLEL
jgi:hypothetical protein